MIQIVPVLSGSLLFSVMISMSAYQQVKSKWWKGPSLAILLFCVGLLVMLVTVYQDSASPNHLVLTLYRTAFIGSFTVFIGSLLALCLRSYLSRRTISAGAAIGVFTLSCVLLSKVDFA